MKKSVQYLVVSFIGSIFFVVLLFLLSEPDSSIKNGFTRKFIEFPFVLEGTITLGTNNYDFAGNRKSIVYLRDVDIPYRLIEFEGTKIKDSIKLTNNLSGRIFHSQVFVGSSSFYMADLDRYIVFKGKINDWSIETKLLGPNFFSEYIPLNDSSIAYRAFSDDKKEYRLIIQRGDQLIDGSGLIQKQIDGLFCTDGVLRYDYEGAIIYTYFYRNEFIKANLDLTLVSRNHTIDTTRVAKISVSRNEKGKYSSLSAPPRIVNLTTEFWRNELLVHSNLKADNEQQSVFVENDVIDIYNMKDGGYRYSFYIPRRDEIKLTHFKIYNDKLFVIRNKSLEIYNGRDSVSIANRE